MQITCIYNELCNNDTMNHEQEFKEQLRAAGERVTSPRLTIFRLLMRNSPLAMSKLITKSREDGIDPVTVYRTLELLRKLNLVQEMGVGRNRLFELSDAYHSHHHHLTCIKCGSVTDFDSETIEINLSEVGKKLGFTVQGHQLEVTGICSSCAKSNRL
jgi:Fur family ferric uptake transcriptional regulator